MRSRDERILDFVEGDLVQLVPHENQNGQTCIYEIKENHIVDAGGVTITRIATFLEYHTPHVGTDKEYASLQAPEGRIVVMTFRLEPV